MNECVICKKEIKGYDAQYINGKYYHNFCIENLQSKIDKAIELIEKEDLITYLRETKDLELANEFEDLYKDLKEDK